MSLVWEIEPGDLTGPKVTSIDLAGTALATAGTGLTLTTIAGRPALVVDADADLATTSTISPPAAGALALMVALPAEYGFWSGFRWTTPTEDGFISLSGTGAVTQAKGLIAAGAGLLELLSPAIGDADFHVHVLKWDGSNASLWMDGTQVATTAAPGDLGAMVGAWRLMQSFSDPGTEPVIAYAGLHSGPVDVAALTATIVADHSPAVLTYVTAAGNLEVSGTVQVSDGDLFTPVVIPDPSPGGSVVPPAPPEPQSPPPGVPDPVLRRVSEVMPAPVLDARGNPVDWTPTTVVNEPYARLQVVVEGVDITYLWGAPLPTPSWDRQEPFGSGTASIAIPQLTAFHVLPAWCRAGANVDIRLVRLDDTILSRFSGVVMSFGHSADSGEFTVECVGVVFADDFQLRQPAFQTAPRDIGDVVADVLNGAISRRHADVAPVITGCQTGVLGGWEPRVTGYITQLLATAVTGGRQWTLQCADRAPVLALKDTTTVTWTTSNGQRGVTVDLVEDWSKAPNVLYGSGIGPDGGRWQNAMYPNWSPDDTPPYPFTNPSTTIRVGTTDAATDTGNGVSLWQAKVGRPVTGVFSQGDRVRAREVQRAGGITIDGIVGPQTWATTFDTGANTGTLECFYMPLAYSPLVMPRLYGPDGSDLGPNPAYNPNVLRVEDKIDYGNGVSKTEGIRAAVEILAREIDPGWVGTITFETDPQECSRYEISEGSNGRLRAFRGSELVLHAAKVDYSDTVTVTVDTKARDFPTLDAILERERNATDPAKAIVKRITGGSIGTDRATFDAESPAGNLPRHAVFSNLWDVRRIPFGAYGSIVRTEITTDSAARAFAVAVFDRPVTAAALLGVVGNPLTATTNPWSEFADELTDLGLLMSWGWAKQPAGYWPQEYSNPDGEGASPLTGRMVDDASWEYASAQVPWLWVATIAAGSCYVSGRFWPGAD